MGRTLYAKVIIDIGHPDVDRVFEYRVPEHLVDTITEGAFLTVPFGNGSRPTGAYVVELSPECEYDPAKIKEIIEVSEKKGTVTGTETFTSKMIKLAVWMRYTYGCTMIQALKTVLPVKKKIAPKSKKYVRALVSAEELERLKGEAERKHYHARVRVYEALSGDEVIPFSILSKNLSITMATLKPMIAAGVIAIDESEERRQKLYAGARESMPLVKLNDVQQHTVDDIISGRAKGDNRPCLIHGITASGKTEIYMELIAKTLEEGRQAIVLIPEIALTYPTMMRFYRRFGDRIGFVHSRLSDGEKYEQLALAAEGKIDIMIGPRSALFTPFPDLGLIVIDEEHDGAYDSETTPRYHTIEVAEKLSELADAGLVLGSATPAMRSYKKARDCEYRLYTIKKRAHEGARLADVSIVDMRAELEKGNRSVFSDELAEAMNTALANGEQIMLFLNRRGYSSFVSCRSCGHVMKCPHCDVSMSFHKSTGRLHCHYCGHEEDYPSVCPECGSKYILGFKSGTQKIEELVKKEFPAAVTIRMDWDTTREKDGYEKILNTFAAGEANVLIGTQMIVKGHDFPKVTVMGVMAADQSLYAPDYTASERTFQLLTQASGRAGRSDMPGRVIIQTYTPDHFSIQTAAAQDYEAFYEQEISYRELLDYPPVMAMLNCLVVSTKEQDAAAGAQILADIARASVRGRVFGPADDVIAKVKDRYRKVLYIKAETASDLVEIRKLWDEAVENGTVPKTCHMTYDTH